MLFAAHFVKSLFSKKKLAPASCDEKRVERIFKCGPMCARARYKNIFFC